MRFLRFMLLMMFAGVFFNSYAQVDFDAYFTEKSLRIDYYLCGNADETKVYFNCLKEEPYWSGPKSKLIDPFRYGNFYIEVFDLKTNLRIYSKGFSSLFQEWQTTSEAKEMNRCYYQVNTVPFPKNPVRLVISMRKRDGAFLSVFEYELHPDNYFIRKEVGKSAETLKVFGEGIPSESLDIAFLAEGYTREEQNKFVEDVKRMASYLFETEPYSRYKERINIWAVKIISQESGTDIPGKKVYKNTALNSTYYTFDIDRYLTTNDLKGIYDNAASAPYDQIYVLINTKDYGGGGFYNYYNACTSDHALTKEVFLHEFGHGFAGLGDEYYSSDVAYDEFYNLEIEPWEPNITTLKNFDLKWKHLIQKGTPIPTPREKKYENAVGVFEGGGYTSKGIYSPVMDCRMKSNDAEGFCPACKEAIEKMILYYLDK